MAKISKILYGLVLVFLVTIAGLTAFSALNLPGSYKLFVVLSGSMAPTIKTGSIVVVVPEKNYQKGDIITFKNPNNTRETLTHRIYGVKTSSGLAFLTKGDANNAPDLAVVSKSQVMGKTVFALPFLGYPVSFAKTQLGLIVLIIIPSVIIVYSELLNIKKEALKLIRERRTQKLNPKEKVEEKKQKKHV